ncbi:MAG: hypothetical protein HY788_05910, partial [Deltaproteobacteria bacterium]|nr:hypothetical protein [Deltaproteobacteria bacterium]
EFPDFLEPGVYRVRPSVESPSSAMIVANPSNLARLIDLYGGHIYDVRDPATGKVTQEGRIDHMPDLEMLRGDIVSISVNNPTHYETMKAVHEAYGVLLDPHGAVGWRSLETFLQGKHDALSVVYETADPGKFPEDVEKALGITPPVPPNIALQADLEERIFHVGEPPDRKNGAMVLSDAQYHETCTLIRSVYGGN